jgi:hypothetical protein
MVTIGIDKAISIKIGTIVSLRDDYRHDSEHGNDDQFREQRVQNSGSTTQIVIKSTWLLWNDLNLFNLSDCMEKWMRTIK